MKNFATGILLFLTLNCISQDFHITNQTSVGGDDIDFMGCINTTNDGGYVIGVKTLSGISGNKTVESYGDIDIWVVKLNYELEIMWQVSYGASSSDIVGDILQDSYDNFYVCSKASNNIEGNITTDIVNGDFFIVKLDSDGNEIWQKSYGGDEGETLYSALFLSDNKILLAGTSGSGISGDKTDFCRGSSDYWIMCIDTAGLVLWDKTYGGESSDILYETVYNQTENTMYLAGLSKSSASFEKSESSINNDYDVWLVKVNANDGNIIWDKTFGSDAMEYTCFVALSNNNIYCATANYGVASGDKTEDGRGQDDYWIVKLDNAGNIIWDKTIGGTDTDYPSDLTVLENNTILISGDSKSSASYEKTEDPLYLNASDFWFVCISENGEILYDKTIGGWGRDGNPRAILNPVTNSVFVAGKSYGAPSGDKTAAHYGEEDIWVIEMNLPTSITEPTSDGSLCVFPNPATDFVNLSSSGSIKTISIFSVSGKLLKTITNPESLQINVTDWDNGLYFMKIETNYDNITTKFIINR